MPQYCRARGVPALERIGLQTVGDGPSPSRDSISFGKRIPVAEAQQGEGRLAGQPAPRRLGLELDLAPLRALRLRNAHVQDAVLQFGLDLLRIDVVG
jgi:hypothetical protein